jgi:AcrR family transcriptional regulator
MLDQDTSVVSPREVSDPRGPFNAQALAVQRARLLAAAVEIVDELGYAGMTVAQVIARARVSQKTFYDVFDDREDCFLAAFEQTHHEAWRLAGEACRSESRWSDRVRLALGTLLAFVEDEPALARLWVVEALRAGDKVLRRRDQALDQFAEVVDEGRLARDGGPGPSTLTSSAVVGGVFAVIHGRLLRGDELPGDMLNSLMSLIVLPYLGPRAARRELERPCAEITRTRRAGSVELADDPLSGLKMRLTYRTVRVLVAIGEQPGASNRWIAERAGIVDEGQISKLLNRLAGLGLIDNRGGGQQKGVANEWHLTPRGVRVERTARPL